MQAIIGRRAVWFRSQRPTESGKAIGNEFEGSTNEEGMKILIHHQMPAILNL